MSKVSDTSTLPEVAGDGGDDASQIHDFLQSEEWQQKIENARKQRKKKLAELDGNRNENSGRKPDQSGKDHSTKRVNDSGPQHLWDRLEEARRRRQAVLARPSAEAEKHAPSESDVGGGEQVGYGAGRATAAPPEVLQKKTGSAASGQKRHQQLAPSIASLNGANSERNSGFERLFPVGDVPAKDDETSVEHESRVRSPSSAGQPVEDAAENIRRKLSFRWPKQQPPDRGRLTSIAIGCGIGVVFSFSTMFVLARWESNNGEKPFASSKLDVDTSRTSTLPEKSSTQSTSSQIKGPEFPPRLTVWSLTQPDASPNSTSIGNILATTENSSIVASALLPMKEMSPDPKLFEPMLPPVAPSLRPDLLTLETPKRPIGTPATQNPQGSVLNSAWSHDQLAQASLHFRASIVLPDVPAIFDSLKAVIANATDPGSSAPEISVELVSLVYAEDQPSTLKQAVAFRSAPSETEFALNSLDNLPKLNLVIPGKVSPPDAPDSNDRTGIDLRELSKAPIPRTEEVSPKSVVRLQENLEPPLTSSETTDGAAKPREDTESAEVIASSSGAEFKLFIPNSLGARTVNSVVNNLVAAGHELSGTARVGFGVKQSNVRFYHKEDAAQATALAEDAGALLRDFTGSKSKTQNGVVELWLAGNSATKSKVKKVRLSASASDQVDQLKRQVLSKLKTATNQ